MEQISLSEKAFSVLMKRQHACCFSYSALDNTFSFEGNLQNQNIFKKDIDPIRAMLECECMFALDKEKLGQFYNNFRNSIGKVSDVIYHEQLIHIKFNDTSDYTPISLAVDYNLGENGTVIGYSGYFVSIANVAAQIKKSITSSAPKIPFSPKAAWEIINNSEHAAIIQFDIKGFKHINQKYGDKTGDEILAYVAGNIEKVWGIQCVGCRLGADIFNIFTPYISDEDIEMRIGFIQSKLQNYLDIKYKFYFGIYIINDKSLDLRKMTDLAALARKTGRENALSFISYYDEKISEKINTKIQIENEMEHALRTGQFKVYLQPKVRISDKSIIGAEALVRWVHPEKGLTSPASFIPVFEQNGFIENLDAYVHEQICILIRKWLDMGITPVSISVNVSQAYLSPELPMKIKKIVDKYSIPIEFLQIEITESFENQQAEIAANCFKELGFTLLMDDFGSGYSSLNTLSNTPFDIIKLDRGFLKSYTFNERCKKVVSHTIAMVDDMGLGLVAEGVETSEQACFLDNSGCKCAQGFLYSRPVPIEDFEQMLFGEKINI